MLKNHHVEGRPSGLCAAADEVAGPPILATGEYAGAAIALGRTAGTRPYRVDGHNNAPELGRHSSDSNRPLF